MNEQGSVDTVNEHGSEAEEEEEEENEQKWQERIKMKKVKSAEAAMERTNTKLTMVGIDLCKKSSESSSNILLLV